MGCSHIAPRHYIGCVPCSKEMQVVFVNGLVGTKQCLLIRPIYVTILSVLSLVQVAQPMGQQQLPHGQGSRGHCEEHCN